MARFTKENVPSFSAEVYQNKFLPEGAEEVNAIVTVTSTGGGTSGGVPLVSDASECTARAGSAPRGPPW